MKHLKTNHIRLLSTGIALFFALPLQLKILTGFYNWLSPFILLNSVFLLKSFVFLNCLGFIILFLSFLHKRWFCHYLCPVGYACDAVSKKSKVKSQYLKKIPAIGRWLYLVSLVASILGLPLFIWLDPMAIFNGFFSVFTEPFSWLILISLIGLPVLLGLHYFFPAIWCAKLCPLGGLFDDLFLLKQRVQKSINTKQHISTTSNTSRRLFIGGGLGLVAGLFIPSFIPANTKKIYRPPASLSDPQFSFLCVRCGSCIKSCPTKIIQHSTIKNSITWMTPELTFEKGGYCKNDCNLCGTVCPSGSISPFSVEAKKQLIIASVNFKLEHCLLSKQTECDRCKAVCSYNAVKIIPAEKNLIMKPEVNLTICVGCGACAAVCPENCIQMIPFSGE